MEIIKALILPILASALLAMNGYTKADVELLAQVIYHENWFTDENHEAARLTGIVVKNRIERDDAWLHLKGEKTVYDVVYAKGQYSTIKKFYTVEIPDECRKMAFEILTTESDVPKDVIFQATFKQGKVYKVINGEYFCYEKGE